MFLKDLAEIWFEYRKCGAWRLAKSIYAFRKMRQYWYVWAASTFYGAASFLVAFEEGAWFQSGVLLTVIGFIFLFASVEKALQKEFSAEYESHAIASHPFGRRRLYLRYALFSKAILKSGRTNQQLKSLLEFAKIADKPAPPFRLFEHHLIVPVVAILSVLASEYIKDSEVWQAGNGYVFIFLIGMGGLFLLALLDLVRSVKQKESELKRFLEWATFDRSRQV